MKAKQIILAVMVVALAGPAQADFVLTGSEHKDVYADHKYGTLFDSSTADMIEDATIENVYLNGESRLRELDYGRSMYNFSVSYLYGYDSSTVEIYSRTMNDLYAYNNSVVKLFGGRILRGYAYDTSSMDISGGIVDDHLRAYGDSIVDISDGEVDRLWAYDSSTVNISGGSMDDLQAYDSSTVNISGGSIYELGACDNSRVTVHAYDYQVTGGLSVVSNEILGTGVLTYKSDEHDDWHLIDISGHDIGATIQIIPEPATLGLLLIGSLGLLRWRK